MVAATLSIAERQVARTLDLLEGGATIPFISRYRKEMTGGLDEVQIGEIKRVYDKLVETGKRKETILASIEAQDKLTDELKRRIEACWDATELEDIYLPYKPKRRTRAEIARQKGLEPLAVIIAMQREAHIREVAGRYVNGQVKDADEALAGASDILAEQFNENERCRNSVRQQFRRGAVISSKVVKGKEEEGAKYRDYFDFSEPLKRCSSHRLLALRRGEAEGILKVAISPDDEACVESLNRLCVKGNGECSKLVASALTDSYKRLIKPSIETEFAAASKQKADDEAIRVFAQNLHQLLLAPPLGQKRVLGLDPGFRTGCKVVCLDAQGNLLHNEAIYPHPPRNEYAQAQRKLQKLVEQYDIQAIAIGNGTASRETESFVQSVRFDRPVEAFVVSEDGASIYSASKIAREEFPEYDVTVRGAVSIGRRLMDPLAELVKIDPKSIGVGQYQHDVDQTKLRETLNRTVESCVNAVGVNLNTASCQLLTYVSGLGPQLAQNIVDYRAENGPFPTRRDLMKVKRMGAKAFEQCAGFLRIPESKEILDNTGVHPESYAAAKALLNLLGCKKGDDFSTLTEKLNAYGLSKAAAECAVGEPTLLDIAKELSKPGRDPRDELPAPILRKDVLEMKDLKPGMELTGTVRNVIDFGVFVDIGVHQDGLVHISEVCDRRLRHPSEVVKVGDVVKVVVLNVDEKRHRISLSMKQAK